MSRVGRISVVAGSTQYQSTAGAWSDALINEPVSAATGLRTAQGAQAEWHSPGARLAIAPSSEVHVLRFDGDALQVTVPEGRIGLHLENHSVPKTVEIDLPYGGVWLSAPGDYDIAAGDAHVPAAVQVFVGKAQLGGGLDDRYITTTAPDSFSDWWRSQDDTADLADSLAKPDIAGAAALAGAGRWEIDSKLGDVWYPSDVAADWVPYRDGAWRFLAPWGWTWIAGEPWGFAPSHYGRWARIDNRWGWVPPQIRAADYSPADVAFLGTAGIGLSRPGDGGSAVAWFPLAPGETIGDGNDANYKNRDFTTAVSRATFVSGLPVAAAMIDDVPQQRFADAPVILQALGIAPGAVNVAATQPKKRNVVIAAAAKPAIIARAPARRSVVVALRGPPRFLRGRLKMAAAVPLRAHLASARLVSSTSVMRSPHNRAHLAAARGGA